MALRLLVSCICIVLFINPVSAADYFWAGGSGRWNDPSMWESDQAGLPGIQDKVWFAEGSLNEGDRVLLEGEISIHSLYIAAYGGSLAGEKVKLSISENLQVTGNTRLVFTGEIRFNGGPEQVTLNFGTGLLRSDLLLAGGNYVLGAGLVTSGNIHIDRASFTSAGNFIQANSFSVRRSNRSVNLDGSAILLREQHKGGIAQDQFTGAKIGSLLQEINSIDSVTVSVTQPLCNGQCNGSVTVNIYSTSPGPFSAVLTSGPQNCTLSLTPTAFGATGTCTGLCANTYGLTVVDSSDLSQTQQFVQVPGPNPILVSNFIKRRPTCTGDCNGWISVNAIGGNPPFTYLWNSGSTPTSQVDSNLCAGNYSVQITDQNGCSQSFNTNLTEPDTILSNASATHISCNGVCDGAATVVPTGGNGNPPNYQYQWTSTTSGFTSTNQNISGLCPGTYVITISDDSLCTGTDTINITQPQTLLLNATSANISCGGACDGVASIAPTGGTAPYTITWSNSGSGNTQTGLCPGTISVTVTDANGCSDSATFNITEPSILLSNISGVDVTCNGACNGSATSAPTGGTGPYSFSWSNGATSTGLTSTINNLCVGTYIVTVTDSNNCTHTDSIVITQPAPLTTTITSTDVSCNGNCDGTATVNIAGGTPGYVILWSNGISLPTVTGLCPDTLTVSVLDANGCITTDTVIITEPPVLNVTVADTTVSCGGQCNGVLNAVVSGGTPNYSYSWSAAGATTPSVSNLCVGTYVVTVTDANGCTDTDTADVQNPSGITAVVTATPASCFGVCDASATVAASGGFPPYSYVWCNGQTGTTATGLCGNTVCNVTITDALGCSFTQSVNITQPSPLANSMSVTNIPCAGVCSGSATATPSGGTAPYTISWNTTPVQTGNTINNLCAGIYVATITDDNGCQFTDTAVITEPAPIQPNLTITDVTCNGLCNGTATVAPTGGTAPYIYSWSSGLPPLPTQSNLCAGSYSVTITDANGCSVQVPVVVSQPGVLNAVVNNINASCGAICDGSASVIVGGGTPPYTYSWSSSPVQTSDTAINLCVGNYTVTVTDSNGCQVILPVVISPVVFISINSTGGQPSCFGTCDGQATAVASGGATPYTYSWSNGQNTQTATGLCGGVMYYVTATDANGCNNTDSIMLTQPPALQLNLSKNDASCGNLCDGTASASASGGTAPYSYLWSTGQTTSNISALCDGTYTVTVTDANGCTYQDSVIILAPSNLQPNPVVTDATCGNADGSVLLAPAGGTGPYSIQWQSPASTANPLNNVPAGVYNVVINDAASCSDTFQVIVNNINGPSVTTSTTTTTCFGVCNGSATAVAAGGTPPYTYSWLPSGQNTAAATNLCAGVHTVTVTDALGCQTSITDTVPGPTEIEPNALISNVTCNAFCDGSIILTPTGGTGAYTYLWQSGQTTSAITNLCPGTYIVTITDGNSCSRTDTFQVSNQTVIAPNPTVVNADCNGGCNGSIVVNPTGGNPGYTYSWSPSGPNSPSNQNLCAGNYTVTITDSLGCTSVSSYTITEPSALSATVTSNNINCAGQCTGSINVTTSGGSGSYTYFWLSGGQSTSSLNNLCAGNYTVTICDSLSPGCCITQTINITEPAPLAVVTSGTNLTCYNACDGTVTANASGGSGGYTYTWMPGNLNGAAQTNLCAGTYTINITDANGCQVTDSIVLTQPSLIASNATVMNAACFGNCDGSITLNPSGGAGNYTYLWSPGGQTTSSITGLCAGNYQVQVTDQQGCMQVFNFTITEPAPVTATFITSPATCGLVPCDGNIFLSPSGGVGGPYSVNWSNGATGNTLTGVCAGLYTAVITDASGCVDSVLVPLNDLNGPVTSHSVTHVSCNGNCDGTAAVQASGVNPPFTFNWTPGGYNVDSVGALCAGTYQVQVTDTLNCVSFETIVINEPLPLQGNPAITDISCTGLCDGTVTMNPSGGTAPYSHSWSNGQTTAALTGLCAGSYTDTITDANGCLFIETVNIIVPNPLVVTPAYSDVTCNAACDGTASVNISGGTAPYTVTWSNGTVQVTGSLSTISGLCDGNYSAQITDANGCTHTENFTIAQPAMLASGAVSSSVTCNGACNGSISLNLTGGTAPYVIQWSNGSSATNLSNLCPGIYNVLITDAGGCQVSQSFTITEPSPLVGAISTTNVSCNSACDGVMSVLPSGGTAPYFYNWSPGGFTTDTVTNVCAGTYTVTVSDSNGCSFTSQITITEPPVIQPNLTIASPPCGSCNGSVTAAASGGSGPAYTYAWNTGSTSSTINNLCAGLYTVDITDVSGCTQQFNVPLSNLNGPTVSLNSTDPTCAGSCDGTMDLNVSGGTTPYAYSWSPGGATTDSIGGLCAGVYFGVVSDATGCITIISDTLTDPPAIQVNPAVTDALCGACDGNVTLAPTGGQGTYTYLWGNGSTNPGLTGLCAGVYPVQVSDSTGCTVSTSVAVSNTGGPTGELVTTTPVSCAGAADGTATITAIGGTAPYTYYWVSTGQTGNTATGLTGGTHQVQITDANGCIRTSQVTIQSPATLQINPQVVNASCGVCDGSITLNPSGGTGPYTITWSGGLPNGTSQTNLCAGIYTVTITDASGCSSSIPVAVNSTNSPSVTISASQVSCFGACDGTAIATASGGAGGYTYLWSDGSTTASISSLCPGTYIVQATDMNGCAGSAQVNITQSTQLNFSLPPVQDATCAGNCDGSATVLPVGGDLPYTYSWSPSGQTSPTATSLCAGIHIVSVTDASGCSTSQSITIQDNPVLNITASSTDAQCGQCDGTATVNVSGGTGPYTYLWADGTITANCSGLCAGIYSVTVADATGCGQQFSVTVNNSTAPSGIITSLTNESCPGAADGAAAVSVSGGTAPYSLLWIPGGQTTNSVSGLQAGVYQVQITDANGCTGFVPVTITSPDTLKVTSLVTNAECGVCDGSIGIQVTGGTAPYTYSWSGGLPPQTSHTGLCAGTYTVTITDAGGCTATEVIPVSNSNGAALSMTSTGITCNGQCDGTAAVTASGGSGSYTYLWTPGGATTSSLTGLCAGQYYVQVTDAASGCVSFNMVTVVEPPVLQAGNPSLKNASCGGTCDGEAMVFPVGGTMPYTYTWPGGNGNQLNQALCAGVNSVTITDVNGCTFTQQFTINEPPPIVIDTLSVIRPGCTNQSTGEIDIAVTGGAPPYNFSWSHGPVTEDVQNLLPGNYTLVVTDSAGCVDSIVIDLQPLVPIAVNAGTDTSYCEGLGPVVLNGSGAAAYQWTLNGTTIGTTASVSVNPGSGTYVYILNGTSAGCTDADTVTVTVFPAPLADAGADQSIMIGDIVTIGGNPSGPSGATFDWTPTEYLSDPDATNPTTSPVQNMLYYLTVTTAQGCSATDSVAITILPEIIFPDGITPNGDGKNDVWIIDNIDLFPGSLVEVYNRWGQVVFSSVGYTTPWDGTYKGNLLPVGTYYYVIDLKDDRYQPYTGPITIMR